jgi:hypothetical protein
MAVASRGRFSPTAETSSAAFAVEADWLGAHGGGVAFTSHSAARAFSSASGEPSGTGAAAAAAATSCRTFAAAAAPGTACARA